MAGRHTAFCFAEKSLLVVHLCAIHYLGLSSIDIYYILLPTHPHLLDQHIQNKTFIVDQLSLVRSQYLLDSVVRNFRILVFYCHCVRSPPGRPPVGKHVGQLVVPIKLISVFTFHLFNEIIIILRLAFRKIQIFSLVKSSIFLAQ